MGRLEGGVHRLDRRQGVDISLEVHDAADLALPDLADQALHLGIIDGIALKADQDHLPGHVLDRGGASGKGGSGHRRDSEGNQQGAHGSLSDGSNRRPAWRSNAAESLTPLPSRPAG